MSNRHCPKCGEDYSDTYRTCPFCEEEAAIKRGKPLRRRSGKRVEKRQRGGSGGAGGVLLLLTGVIILGVVGYVFFGEQVADAMGIRTDAGQEDLQEPPVPDGSGGEPDGAGEPAIPDGPDGEPDGAGEPAVTPPEGDAPDSGGAEPAPSEPDPEPAGPLALSQSSISIPAGETALLTASGGSGEVSWSTSNENIATVEGGSVTGKAGGTVTITAAAGEETAECRVTITGDPWVSTANLSLNKTDFTFGSSEKVTLKVKGTDSPVTWSSANTGVATVSDGGVVQWAGKGTTTVTASVDGQTLECIVRAK